MRRRNPSRVTQPLTCLSGIQLGMHNESIQVNFGMTWSNYQGRLPGPIVPCRSLDPCTFFISDSATCKVLHPIDLNQKDRRMKPVTHQSLKGSGYRTSLASGTCKSSSTWTIWRYKQQYQTIISDVCSHAQISMDRYPVDYSELHFKIFPRFVSATQRRYHQYES